MAIKVTDDVLKRILELRYKYCLTQQVIATRLGLAPRTVRTYLSAHRKAQEEHVLTQSDPAPSE